MQNNIETFSESLKESEIFDYTQISKDEFIEKSELDENFVFGNYGPRVRYFQYNNSIIAFGTFKKSNKCKIKLWNVENIDFEIIMSIVKEYQYDKNKYNDVYIEQNIIDNQLEYYKKTIINIINNYNLNTKLYVISDKKKPNELIISRNSRFITERDIMVMKHIITEEMKNNLDYLDEVNELKRKNKNVNIQRMVNRKRSKI